MFFRSVLLTVSLGFALTGCATSGPVETTELDPVTVGGKTYKVVEKSWTRDIGPDDGTRSVYDLLDAQESVVQVWVTGGWVTCRGGVDTCADAVREHLREQSRGGMY